MCRLLEAYMCLHDKHSLLTHSDHGWIWLNVEYQTQDKQTAGLVLQSIIYIYDIYIYTISHIYIIIYISTHLYIIFSHLSLLDSFVIIGFYFWVNHPILQPGFLRLGPASVEPANGWVPLVWPFNAPAKMEWRTT